MAMSAEIACNPTSVQATANGEIAVNLTVSNSATAAVRVVSITPTLRRTGSAQREVAGQVGVPVLNGSNASVPGEGSRVYSWSVKLHAPRAAGVGYPGAKLQDGDKTVSQSPNPTMQYDVGVVVSCADGSVLIPTPVTVDVTPGPRTLGGGV